MRARSLGLVLGSAALASADCAVRSFNEGGNFFCQAVARIQYTNVGHTATYEQVVGMDQNSGACQKVPKAFGGPMAPFDEEMSIHLRGPLRLKQFAAYTLGGAKKKREEEEQVEEAAPVVKRSGPHRHSHAHLHEKRKKARRNQKDRRSEDADAVQVEARAPRPAGEGSPSIFKSSKPAIVHDWTRIGYYDAPSQTSQGLTFLGNYGGEGSGKFT